MKNKKVIFGLIILLALLSSCSKKQTNIQNDKLTASEVSIEQPESVSDNSIKLIKPELVTRIIPERWVQPLSDKDSKYTVGEMKNKDGIWLCLIHFSEDLKQSNIEECSQITNIKQQKS